MDDLFVAAPAERRYAELPVTVELGGYELNLPVHYLRGHKDGPTVTLLATLHGNEWLSIEIVRRILATIKVEQLRGSLLAVPVANPPALTALTRNTPDDSDTPDMNRSFPGKANWASGLFAQTLVEEILPHTDYLLDYHTLCWGSAFGVVIYQEAEDDAVTEETDALAQAFGYPSIHRGLSVAGTSASAAAKRGIPALAVEIGGAGWGDEDEESWLEQNISGTLNVLRHLNMIDGDVARPDAYYYWGKRWRLHPSVGGYLQSETGPERLLGRVDAGEELGRVVSTASFEVLETIEAPADGWLYSIARSYPVRPGGWAYGVVDLDTTTVVEP